MSIQNTIRIGQTLTARSIGDHNCIFTAFIIDRKGKFATVKAMNAVKRVKIFIDDNGVEFIFALGRYSMAPVFRAPAII